MTNLDIFAIACDSGKYNTKAVFEIFGGMRTSMIRTAFRPGHEALEKEENVHQVEMFGKRITVGDAADGLQADNLELEKDTELHQYATLTTICKALKQANLNKAEINLAINIPLTQYTDEKLRKNIENLYLKKDDNGDDVEYFIIFEGEEYRFTIKNVLVLYETAGIVAKYRTMLKDTNTLIVDCGGLNVTRLAVIDGKVMLSTASVNDCGSNNLIKSISRDVYSKTGRKLSNGDILKAIKKEKEIIGKNAEKINEIIEFNVNKFIDQIILDLKQDVDLDSFEILLIGGSSMLYNDLLSRKLNRKLKLSTDAIFDNVNGYYALMKAKKLA